MQAIRVHKATRNIHGKKANGCLAGISSQDASNQDVVENLHKQFTEYGKNAREWTKKCELLLPAIASKRVWKRKKFASIYEYAAKLAGMSRHKVDDALRILSKIADKPELRKVAEAKGLQRIRPVATIATKETEAFWADKARNMSKHTLATYVHDYRLEFRPGATVEPVKSSETTKSLQP